jgi:hypothetical protein
MEVKNQFDMPTLSYLLPDLRNGVSFRHPNSQLVTWITVGR